MLFVFSGIGRDNCVLGVVVVFSNQVSCLAMMLPPFVQIKSFQDFWVFGGLNLTIVGCMHVTRVSGDWYVPVGWIPASAATTIGAYVFNYVRELNILPLVG